MKKLAILGSTGSIGTQALDIISQNPNDFQVITLTAHSNIDLLERQILQFRPKLVAVTSPGKAEKLKERLIKKVSSNKSSVDQICTTKMPSIISGPESLTQAATHPEVDLVLTAIVGEVGIQPTHAAIKAGKNIALANKETLVAAGELIMNAAKEANIQIIPVDSEHSAIFQCLEGRDIKEVEKIILTCSGGPFHGMKTPDLENITPEEALKHPTWNMGKKISIDSATLANKGLEVIEAHYLFGLPPEKIEVVIHPQSIIHSLVQFKDGNILAQMGVSDMRIPISYALYYPNKATNQLPRLPLPTFSQQPSKSNSEPNKTMSEPLSNSQKPLLTNLTFDTPDTETFPALKLAYQAIKTGGQAPAIYNKSNEEAVTKFLNKEIKFLDIPKLIETSLYKRTRGLFFIF